MKVTRIAAAAAIVLASLTGRAQGVNQPPAFIWVTTAPTGACTPGTMPQMVVSTGVLWTCQSSVWAALGGSSGGGGSFSPTLPAPPTLASNFTNVNFQTGTVATQSASGAITISIPYISALNWQLIQYNSALPTAPWRVSAFMAGAQIKDISGAVASNTTTHGIYLIDTAGTKLEGIEGIQTGTSTIGSTLTLRAERMNSVTSDGSTIYNTALNVLPIGYSMPTGVNLSWCYDGTTIYAQYSWDGQKWLPLITDSGFITPTHVAFGGVSQAGSNDTTNYTVLLGFKVQTVGVSCTAGT